MYRNTIPRRFHDYVLLIYTEAVEGDDKSLWLEAIDEEKNSLFRNNIWKEVSLEDTGGVKIISSKWVFTIKENGRYKARLVARGFEQEKGLNFEKI